MYALICRHCNTSFQNKHRHKKFCSDVCKYKAHYIRRKDYYTAHNREYYLTHKETEKQRSIEWMENNKEKWKLINNKATRKYKEKTRYGNMRETVYKKYGGKCYFCGTTESLDIHHKDRISYHNSEKPNNSLDNLVLLCDSCHSKLHHVVPGYFLKDNGGHINSFKPTLHKP